jgi:hypothetical protein
MELMRVELFGIARVRQKVQGVQPTLSNLNNNQSVGKFQLGK